MSAPRAACQRANRDAVGRSPGSVAARSGPACGISRSRRKPSSSASASSRGLGPEQLLQRREGDRAGALLSSTRNASAVSPTSSGSAFGRTAQCSPCPFGQRLVVAAGPRVADDALAEVARDQQVAEVLERDPVAVREVPHVRLDARREHLRAQAVEVRLAT